MIREVVLKTKTRLIYLISLGTSLLPNRLRPARETQILEETTACSKKFGVGAGVVGRLFESLGY